MTEPPGEPLPGRRRLAPPYVSQQFTSFLTMRNVAVIDVVRGAAPNTRRLFLGEPTGDTVTHVVAVTHGHGEINPIDNERSALEGAHGILRPTVRRSLPEVVGRVEVYTGMSGLVLTAVPGLRVSGRNRRETRTQHLFHAMPAWFAAVWQDTAGRTVQVDLGAAATVTALEREERSLALQPALDTVRKAQRRLGQYEVSETLTHGCLCPQHVIVSGDDVGVEDWGCASLTGSPIRDLGRFAANIAGNRLPEVLRGKSSFAAGVRRFMSAVLVQTPVPRQLWREVLILAQFELALEALEQADPNRLLLLSRALRAFQGNDDNEVNDPCTRS